MVLRFVDSFDHYSTLTQKWTTTGTGGVRESIATDQFRTGTQALKTTRIDGGVAVTLDAQGTWVIGLGIRFGAFPGVADSSQTIIASLVDGNDSQCGLCIKSDGTMFATRGGIIGSATFGTNLGAIGTYSFLTNTWYHLEVKFVVSDTVGSVTVRVNGVEVGSLTNQDTKATANATANQVNIGRRYGGTAISTYNTWYDDLYITDGAGAIHNTIGDIGDVKVAVLVPNGAGNYAQWTPSAGANWQNVDEQPPDSDTTYNETATVTNKDSFTMTDLPASATSVKGVQTCMFARKTDAGTRIIRRLIRTAATDFEGADQSVGDTYQYWLDPDDTNPNTGAEWVVATLNAAEFGVVLNT